MLASKDKSVSFKKIVKQEFNDNDLDFDFKKANYYSDDDKKNVKNDDEKFMTLRKVVSKDSNDEQDELKE